MEYFIALRNGSKQGDLSAANALMELQPYAVIAAEQAMDRKDFLEAERLRRLVAAADPQAPSLARIASAIASGLRGDTKVIPEEKPATSQAEAVVAAAPALAPTGSKAAVPGPISAPVSRATASAPVAGPPLAAVTAPADFQTPVTVAGRPPAAAPTLASRRAELIAVRTPTPEYPEEKRRKGEAGLVVASFTVNSDGTVGEVRTESIGSRQLAFERSVARAVKRWKYQPPGESRSVTQSFSLAP